MGVKSTREMSRRVLEDLYVEKKMSDQSVATGERFVESLLREKRE